MALSAGGTTADHLTRLTYEGETKAEEEKLESPLRKLLLEHVWSPVCGPSLGTIMETARSKANYGKLPFVVALWFVVCLILLGGQLMALSLYYEYKPSPGVKQCKQPFHTICLGLGILGLAMWPIGIVSKVIGRPVIMRPIQALHCVGILVWLIIGIPWIAAIDVSKVHVEDSLDPLAEPSMCASDLYWFVIIAYSTLASGFVLALCCLYASLGFGGCPQTLGVYGDPDEQEDSRV